MENHNSPAFQFYPKDWLTDSRVVSMTTLQRGIYIQLLCYCWLEGWLPKDPKKLSMLSGVQGMTEQEFLEHWEAIEPCFEVIADGKGFIHPRLERERVKQQQWKEKCSKGGKASASKRKLKGNTSFSSSSLSSKDLTPSCSDSGESKPGRGIGKDDPLTPFIRKFSDWDLGMAKTMIRDIVAIAPQHNFNGGNAEKWADVLRMMRNIDKIPEAEIQRVWLWANRSAFWQSNILSPGKLREKFSQLKLKMAAEKPDSGTGQAYDGIPKDEPVPHNELADKIKAQLVFAQEHLDDDKWDGAAPNTDWLNMTVGNMILEYSERWPKGPYMRQFEQKFVELSNRVLENG